MPVFTLAIHGGAGTILKKNMTPQKEKISRGNWYFNRKKLLLVYIARTGATFQGSEAKHYQFKIELLRDPDGANGLKPAETSKSTTIEGIVLNQVQLPK